MSITDWLLDPTGLTAHGFCLSWAPGLVALHAVSDAVTGLAYFSIPLALSAFVWSRKDLEIRWPIYLFIAFILACGATHFFSILTLWVPVYGIEGLVKALTAILSVATAIALWPLLPVALALPSPAVLRTANERLALTVEDLELRVAERTSALEESNSEPRSIVAERDLLLREVYHRVKNNLQVVDSMLMLQALKLEEPEAKQALLGLQARVFALGLVHQQLMSSADLKTFDVAPFLRELLANISVGVANEQITLKVDAHPLDVGLDFAVPLGLLVTEIVTNSLKHAFDERGGNVSVVLRPDDLKGVSLVVSDDGRGYSQEPSRPQKMGLGTTIIKRLVTQLGGEIVMRHEAGAIIEITLPLPEAS